jgi:hypothetical protein
MYLKCIDDTGRPHYIPIENWLIKDDIYLGIGICKETQGVFVEEIDLSQYGNKHKAFNRKRFKRATVDEIGAFKAVRGLLNELNIKIKV